MRSIIGSETTSIIDEGEGEVDVDFPETLMADEMYRIVVFNMMNVLSFLLGTPREN